MKTDTQNVNVSFSHDYFDNDENNMAITITQPAKGATANVGQLTVKGTASGIISKVDVGARIPDVGPTGYGLIVNATTTNQYGNWTALITVPDTRYTRILARTYDSAGKQNGQTFNDVKYGSGGSLDFFGFPKVYADSPLLFAPKPWIMGQGNYLYRITQWGVGSGSGWTDGNTAFDFNNGTSNVRLNVWAGPDSNYSLGSLNRSTMIKTLDEDGVNRGGLMATGGLKENWRNVVISMLLYLYPMSGDDTCGWYGRGGKHGGSAPPCEGFKYEPNLFYAGGVPNCNKETAHDGGGQNAKRNAKESISSGNCVGQWLAWQTIIVNKAQAGTYPDDSSVPLFPVHLGLRIKRTGLTNPATVPSASVLASGYQTWTWDDYAPNWGNNPCGGVASAIGSFGGPEVTFRADRNGDNVGYGHIKIAKLIVREVNPLMLA